MFGFFKKKQADSLQREVGKGVPIISAFLLEGTSFPAEDFLKQAAKTRFAGKSVSSINPGDGSVFSFDVADEFVASVIMPAPYPDLEGPIATTWMWPEKPPIENVKQHRSHLLITMTGGSSDPVRRRLILTAVTSLAARQPGVMAVYWPEASLVLFPPIFTSFADDLTSPEAPPLYLWVDLRAFWNPDGTTGMFTVGLAPLGLMEIEIPRIEMGVGELREWLLNIMYYLLEKGPVLKHGETIGISAEQMIRIRHCASKFGHSGKVTCLEP